MQIVIHCGGMPFNGDTIKNGSLGGSETAAYYMADSLASQGHDVILFTNSPDQGLFGKVTYVYSGEISQNFPLGKTFHMYATNTPHDVLIIQRSAIGFHTQYASKLNILWLHDLALFRQKDLFNQQMWNVDAVLTVSEYHRAQVCDVYGLNPDNVFAITNGVDLSLYEGEIEETLQKDLSEEFYTKRNLIYSSRPERGLENLVMPDGIMERLFKAEPSFHLYVCTYDNVAPHMKPMYDYLWQRCEELPNVTNIGSLTKQQLADVQRQCIACVYPTTFEEVSCITAMECMAAGIGFISSEHAALPETCKGSGSKLIPLVNGQVDIGKFVRTVNQTKNDTRHIKDQVSKANEYSWENASVKVEAVIDNLFTRNKNIPAIAKGMLANSDIYLLKELLDVTGDASQGKIIEGIVDEVSECYAFMDETSWGDHYEKYYQYEKERGVVYGPEDVSGTSRFQCVANMVANSIDSSDHPITVLDYGCAHGHYTIGLAKRFPQAMFVGIDIAESNIISANAWASKEEVTNARFFLGEMSNGELKLAKDIIIPDILSIVDVIIAAEVVEHVPDYVGFVNGLMSLLPSDGKMIITTPYGPWESIGYKQHWPWRAHVNHFTRNDIDKTYKNFKGYQIVTVPSGRSPSGENIGSYVYTYLTDGAKIENKMSLKNRLELSSPRQTLSLCMIVRNGAADILRCLESSKDIVDEIIIGIDDTTTDCTKGIVEAFCNNNRIPLTLFDIESPLLSGFEVARNKTISKAVGQWILWMDADEVLHQATNINKYLRQNQFGGYAVKQHHFAVEPLGVLKTDLPCRIFRNFIDIEFYGVVHEHPERNLNEGVGHVTLIHDACIEHHGYPTEDARRGRFQRNIALMHRDREVYPDRKLGKFLWIRDLSQMNTYEMEQNGGQITPAMQQRAKEGITLWEELLLTCDMRMMADSLPFYSALVNILGAGFDFSFALKGSKEPGQADINKAMVITARFLSPGHLAEFMSRYTQEEIGKYESRYF